MPALVVRAATVETAAWQPVAVPVAMRALAAMAVQEMLAGL